MNICILGFMDSLQYINEIGFSKLFEGIWYMFKVFNVIVIMRH